MIRKLIRYLFRLRPSEKIRHVPRMYASKYKSYNRDEADLMIVLGIRSPSGVKTAMRREKVQAIGDLIQKIKPFRAKSPWRKRWHAMLGRIVGGHEYKPHERQIDMAMKTIKTNTEIKNRLNNVIRQYDDLD